MSDSSEKKFIMTWKCWRKSFPLYVIKTALAEDKSFIIIIAETWAAHTIKILWHMKRRLCVRVKQTSLIIKFSIHVLFDSSLKRQRLTDRFNWKSWCKCRRQIFIWKKEKIDDDVLKWHFSPALGLVGIFFATLSCSLLERKSKSYFCVVQDDTSHTAILNPD